MSFYYLLGAISDLRLTDLKESVQLSVTYPSRDLGKLSGHKRKRYLSYMLLRLFIKLTLISPFKRAVICKIKRENFSVDFRNLDINNVKVNIPNGLRKEILVGIKTTEELKNIKMLESDFLFTFLDEGTFRFEDFNTWFCNFLREFEIINIPDNKTTYSVETIRNSVIEELISNGFNLPLISKTSGVSLTTLESRYYKVKSYESEDINKLTNDRISGIPYYSYI